MKKINIGDWVTQYRTGYWKVKELHPKYSPFDCDRLHKGEPIGVEAVLQKAFNNTFKFNMEMSTCDLSLCQHVTKAVMRKIEKYFKEHPDDEIKFETSQLPVPPNVTAIHLNIDDAQRDHISSLLNIELPNLTYPKVKEILSDNGLTEVLCGAENTLLFLYGYSWEQNENFDMIYSNTILRESKTQWQNSESNFLIYFTTVQRNYPIGSVDLNRNHSSDVLV